MLGAILAGAFALVLVAAILVVLYVVLRGRKTENVSVKRDVRSIQSVGVKSSLPDSHRIPAGGVARGASPSQPVANPSDALKSRFTAIGVVAGLIFGTLATKLWSMQVLSGESFKKESEDNQYTTVYTPAPRGYILDADGNAIVKNRTSLTVLADPDVADDHDVVARLSTVLGVPDGIVRKRIKDSTSGAQSQRVVASDASMRNVALPNTPTRSRALPCKRARYAITRTARWRRMRSATSVACPLRTWPTQKRAAIWSWATRWAAAASSRNTTTC